MDRPPFSKAQLATPPACSRSAAVLGGIKTAAQRLHAREGKEFSEVKKAKLSRISCSEPIPATRTPAPQDRQQDRRCSRAGRDIRYARIGDTRESAFCRAVKRYDFSPEGITADTTLDEREKWLSYRRGRGLNYHRDGSNPGDLRSGRARIEVVHCDLYLCLSGLPGSKSILHNSASTNALRVQRVSKRSSCVTMQIVAPSAAAL